MSNPTNRQASAFDSAGDSAPRMDVRKDNPQLARVIEKLVAPSRSTALSRRENQKVDMPDMGLYQKISDETLANVHSSASMVQLLPDLELAMQILISSILSPKDMVSTQLTFTVDNGVFTSELSGLMLESVRNFFENTYKISDDLTVILENILFYKGAHILAVLPENSIDDLINDPRRVTLESLGDFYDSRAKTFRHLGILGTSGQPKTRSSLGLESLFSDPASSARESYEPTVRKNGQDLFVSIIDNPAILKMPMVAERVRRDQIEDRLSLGKIRRVSTESQRADSLYRTRRYRNTSAISVTPGNQLKRPTEGRPLVMTLPTEAVIPVHVPSNPEEHLGYFVLLDELGNPLIRNNDQDYFNELAAGMQQNREMVNQLVSRTDRNTRGLGMVQGSERQQEIDELSRVYGEIVEQELYTRLKNGVYGDNAQISRPSEVYRIMLARSLQQQRTQLLYVPAEMVSYMAFSYNKYGIGESLLQGSKIVGSIRAMLLFANTMASIKNSVGRTKLAIQLDPQDPDPSATVEFLINEYARATQNAYPLGVTAPRDLVQYLQNAAVEVEVSGNTAYPETKMEIQDGQSNRTKPDTELENSMRDRHLMSLGLSPEVVDAGTKAEFATTVLANNLLLAKRVMNYQRKLCSQLGEFVQLYAVNDGTLMDELRKILKDNIEMLGEEQKATIQRIEDKGRASDSRDQRARDEDDRTSHQRDRDEVLKVTSGESIDAVIYDFIKALRVTLPSPDVGSLENQMAAFDKYVESLDKALKAYLDPEFLEASQLGELQEVIAPTIAAVKAHYVRQWLRNNNVLPELDDLITFGEEGGPAVDLLKIHETHVEGLGKSLAEFMQRIAKSRAKTDAIFNATKDTGGEEGEASGDSSGSDDAGNADTDLGDPPSFDDTEAGGGEETADSADVADSDDPTADLPDDLPGDDAGETQDESTQETAEEDKGDEEVKDDESSAKSDDTSADKKPATESFDQPGPILNMFSGRFPPPLT